MSDIDQLNGASRRAHVRERAGASKARRANRAVGSLLLIVGGAAALWTVVAPQAMERTYGQARTALITQVDQVRTDVFGQLPTVVLGTRGGIPELDRCDGTFTEMLSYERDGVPPVWAAHNNCGGDVTLAWERGQRIRVAGEERTYEVVGIRYTSKIWSSTDDLVGLGGDLALQTCFYGEDRMKFVALAALPT